MPDVTARSNRRLTARHACHLTVRYRWQGDWRPASAMDLSLRGCRLRLGEDLPRHAPVDVAFETPPRANAPVLEVEASGSVMWSRREGLSYQVGIHFEDPPAALEQVLDALTGTPA